MRKILFRGKPSGNAGITDWVYGAFCPQNSKGNIPCIIVYNGKVAGHWFEVTPETVGQYTGLTDKNGTKIFEGDILRFSYTGKNHGVEGVAAVEFENGKFGVKWGWHKEFVPLDGFANTTIEVVGNIYDNPELMGGEYKKCTLEKS